jgi:solute carrier family 13 (sodium-dependent dicarboxylate transporter), member 2/3/5
MGKTSQTSANGSSPAADHFLGRFAENIRSSGMSPRKTLTGFFAAWVVFFYIAWLMPLPEGMLPAGKGTLAVLVWATIMWISEALPVGVTGLVIPMLLVMGGAVSKFPAATSGFGQPVARSEERRVGKECTG